MARTPAQVSSEGNAYIDFTSGIGVSDLGYGCQPWVDAISAQAKKLGHSSNLFYIMNRTAYLLAAALLLASCGGSAARTGRAGDADVYKRPPFVKALVFLRKPSVLSEFERSADCLLYTSRCV